MNKKNLAVVYLLILTVGTLLNFWIPKTEVAAQSNKVIPQDAIRLRILANSNSDADQKVKREIRDAVKKDIDSWMVNVSSKVEAEKIIESHLGEIQQIAEKIMDQSGLKESVKVELAPTKFPAKLYGDYLYPAGTYDAVKISLGAAEGENWWCVVYPPLCFLDFNSGTATEPKAEQKKEKEKEKEKDEEEVKAKFLFADIFKKLFD